MEEKEKVPTTDGRTGRSLGGVGGLDIGSSLESPVGKVADSSSGGNPPGYDGMTGRHHTSDDGRIDQLTAVTRNLRSNNPTDPLGESTESRSDRQVAGFVSLNTSDQSTGTLGTRIDQLYQGHLPEDIGGRDTAQELRSRVIDEASDIENRSDFATPGGKVTHDGYTDQSMNLSFTQQQSPSPPPPLPPPGLSTTDTDRPAAAPSSDPHKVNPRKSTLTRDAFFKTAYRIVGFYHTDLG